MLTGKDSFKKLYPSLTQNHLKETENARCPFAVSLPLSLKETISQVVSEFLTFKKEFYSTDWQDSVLNSLDFHYSSEKLKLIEANTNASGYLLTHLLENNPENSIHFENILLNSFQKVFATSAFDKIAICDREPEKERMFAEFIMFKDFFTRKNIDCSIVKTQSINTHPKHYKFIYNRDTDFYLENSPQLKKEWERGHLKLSTSPISYKNIASKSFNVAEQAALLSSQYENLKNATLNVLPLSEKIKEELWGKRKFYFLKPSESFGSKGVYSGKSISKKKFMGLGENYIAQEFHPPGKVEFHDATWKFDVRAYFSEGSVQKIVARVYQGQLTNFTTKGSGFSLINWK